MRNDLKKTIKRKIISLALSLVMLLSVMVLADSTALADGYAQADFEADIAAAPAGGTVTVSESFALTGDVTIAKEVTITSGPGVTIDTGGNSLAIGAGGDVTMSGNLKVTGNGKWTGAITVQGGGCFTLAGDALIATTAEEGGFGVDARGGAVRIIGGSISADESGGVAVHAEHALVDISGGAISATDSSGMGVMVYGSTANIGGSAQIAGGVFVREGSIVNLTASDGLDLDAVSCGSKDVSILGVFLAAPIPAPVSVTSGGTAAVTLAGVDEGVTYTLGTGTDTEALDPDLSGNTVTLAPPSATDTGSYRLVLTAAVTSGDNAYTLNLTVPVAVQAPEFAGGDGLSAATAYQIATPSQLNNMRNHPAACFVLANDIDMSAYFAAGGAGFGGGMGWDPIGLNSTSSFTGSFDGRGHSISGFRSNQQNNNDIGLFGVLGNGGAICNLTLTGAYVQGRNDVGGLVGLNNWGSISNCSVTGSVTGSSSVGGLVGRNNGTISDCYATAYAVCDESSEYIGGLVGYNNGAVSDCYAAGAVAGSSNLGGLIGFNTGGGTVTASYYNSQTSGRSNDDTAHYGFPKTSAQMVLAATFEGWYFDTTWNISAGASYPYLKNNVTDPLPAPPAATSVTVSPATLTLTYGGGTGSLSASVAPNSALQPVAWSSDHEDVAKVDASGVVTPVSAGSATITAKNGAASGTASVTVNKKTLTVTGSFTVQNKPYDGTTDATIGTNGLTLVGVVDGDDVTLSAKAAFSDAAVGNGKTVTLAGSTLSGAQAGNYALSLDGAPTFTADITKGIAPGAPAAPTLVKKINNSVTLAPNSELEFRMSGGAWQDSGTFTGLTPGATYVFTCRYKATIYSDPVESAGLTVTTYAISGSGTAQNPWQITTAEQLDNIRNYLDGHFKLAADVNLGAAPYNAGSGWTPIGDADNPFTGTFDGGGHTISGLYINLPDVSYVGLFGTISSGGAVSATVLTGLNVTGENSVGSLAGSCLGSVSGCRASGNVTGRSSVGGLAGWCEGTLQNCACAVKVVSVSVEESAVGGLIGWAGSNDEGAAAVIQNCSATGAVTAGDGSGEIGGLAGYVYGTAENCSATGAVSAGEDGWCIGGLIGESDDSSISGCYATGAVSAGEDGWYIGGLIGENDDGSVSSCYAASSVTSGANSGGIGGLAGYVYYATLQNCYATGAATSGANSEGIGGLIGYMEEGTIENCYAVGAVSAGEDSEGIGGSVGENYDSSVLNCFYDSQVSGQSDNDGRGAPKTTAEMKKQATFESVGWNFTAVWKICENQTYPILTWQSFPSSGGGGGGGGTVAPSQNATVSGGGSLPVTVNTNNGSASVNLGTLAGTLASGGNVTVTLPGIPGVSTYTANLPASSLTGGSGSLTLNTSSSSVTIPGNMLAGMNLTGSAGITIGEGNKSNLRDDVQAAIGDRPVIQLTLTVNGQQTDWNNPNAPVTVSIPYTPTAEELNNPAGIVVWYIDGSGNLVSVPNGHYDPATGKVTFSTTHFSDYAVGYNKVSFSDVAANAWYSKAVVFIAARNITTGTGNGKYSPDAQLSRGDFLVMLMKAYGIAPDANATNNFSDAGNTYYTNYLSAAKRLGISAGVGNNMFAPEKEITRQEMSTLLYNALKVIGCLPKGDSGKALSDFTDAGQIASWAKDAMTLLVQTGTIGGSNGMLAPTGTTTRAEMAQVLYNILSK